MRWSSAPRRARTARPRRLGIVRDVVKNMAKEGPTEAELVATKKYMIGAYAINNLDSSGAIAATLVELQLDKLGIDYMQRRAALIDARDARSGQGGGEEAAAPPSRPSWSSGRRLGTRDEPGQGNRFRFCMRPVFQTLALPLIALPGTSPRIVTGRRGPAAPRRSPATLGDWRNASTTVAPLPVTIRGEDAGRPVRGGANFDNWLPHHKLETRLRPCQQEPRNMPASPAPPSASPLAAAARAGWRISMSSRRWTSSASGRWRYRAPRSAPSWAPAWPRA